MCDPANCRIINRPNTPSAIMYEVSKANQAYAAHTFHYINKLPRINIKGLLDVARENAKVHLDIVPVDQSLFFMLDPNVLKPDGTDYYKDTDYCKTAKSGSGQYDTVTGSLDFSYDSENNKYIATVEYNGKTLTRDLTDEYDLGVVAGRNGLRIHCYTGTPWRYFGIGSPTVITE